MTTSPIDVTCPTCGALRGKPCRGVIDRKEWPRTQVHRGRSENAKRPPPNPTLF